MSNLKLIHSLPQRTRRLSMPCPSDELLVLWSEAKTKSRSLSTDEMEWGDWTEKTLTEHLDSCSACLKITEDASRLFSELSELEPHAAFSRDYFVQLQEETLSGLNSSLDERDNADFAPGHLDRVLPFPSYKVSSALGAPWRWAAAAAAAFALSLLIPLNEEPPSELVNNTRISRPSLEAAPHSAPGEKTNPNSESASFLSALQEEDIAKIGRSLGRELLAEATDYRAEWTGYGAELAGSWEDDDLPVLLPGLDEGWLPDGPESLHFALTQL